MDPGQAGTVIDTGNGRLNPKLDGNYLSFTRGVLALGVRNGVGEAAPSFAYIDEQVRATHSIPWRWSLK
jgi:hypothetical protein